MFRCEVESGDILYDCESQEYCVVEINGDDYKLQYKGIWLWFDEMSSMCEYVGHIETSAGLVSDWYDIE